MEREDYVLTDAGYVKGPLTQEEVDEINDNWDEYVYEYTTCRLF